MSYLVLYCSCVFSVLLALRLPRLGKRGLILVLFVRLFGLSLFGFVGFLFLLVSGKGCDLWLWHSLDFFLYLFFFFSPDAFHQVLAQSDPLFGRRCCLKSFKISELNDDMSSPLFDDVPSPLFKVEAQRGQKSLSCIRLIMICYIVPCWPSWLLDQIAFSNSESPCRPNASHQVFAQSYLAFRSRYG